MTPPPSPPPFTFPASSLGGGGPIIPSPPGAGTEVHSQVSPLAHLHVDAQDTFPPPTPALPPPTWALHVPAAAGNIRSALAGSGQTLDVCLGSILPRFYAQPASRRCPSAFRHARHPPACHLGHLHAGPCHRRFSPAASAPPRGLAQPPAQRPVRIEGQARPCSAGLIAERKPSPNAKDKQAFQITQTQQPGGGAGRWERGAWRIRAPVHSWRASPRTARIGCYVTSCVFVSCSFYSFYFCISFLFPHHLAPAPRSNIYVVYICFFLRSFQSWQPTESVGLET